MKLQEIAAARLRIQGLCDGRFASAEAVVGWLGAVQSQEYALARWSIGERVRGLPEREVDRALAEGTILRTHVLRPTWHYVLPEDLRWMQELTAPRVRVMMNSYDRKLELTPEVYARSAEVLQRELEGGRHRTRTQLGEALGAAGIEAKGQRLGHLMMGAELDALICSGIPSGKQTTYSLYAERAPRPRRLDLEEALAELTRRYFTSHGPATLRDFRWWSSLTAAQAKRGVEMLAGELERIDADGRAYWWVPAADPGEDDCLPAHLLQAYDEFVVAYTESRDALDAHGITRSLPDVFPFSNAVILGGQGVGRWRRRLAGRRTVLEFQLARPLKRRERQAVDRAVARYADFSGTAPEVVIDAL